MDRSLDVSIEPAAEWQLTSAQKERLTELLDGYLSRLEQGLPPSRDELLRANADLAEPLATYFQSLDELHDMAGGFQGPGRAERSLADRGSAKSAEPPASSGDDKRLGDFRLLREIGRGGMGVVYEAQQISLDRRVALKVLPFAAVLDSRQIARFKHEAQAAGQLNHPNIVSVFAVGVERGVHYYAMQFIDGQPLDRVIDEMRQRAKLAGPNQPTRLAPRDVSEREATSNGHMSSAARHLAETDEFARSDEEHLAEGDENVKTSVPRSTLASWPAGGHGRATLVDEIIRGVIRLGIDAARALHAAHESGIVHRDIKPSNLLLDGNGKVWVTDFGLARRQTDPTLTRTGDLIGTMRYMSPEQAAGQMAMVDHRTDVYSLSATLYEMLTLEPAIVGDDGHALLRQIERHDPRPPRQLQPKVSPDLQTVIMKGMAKRRDDRYATAADFADDLQRVLEGKSIVARPPSLLDRALRAAQRHREVAVAAAAVCLLAVVGLGLSTFLIAREQQKTAMNYERAEKNFGVALGTVEDLGLRLSDELASVPGADPVRKRLLQKTLGQLRGFAGQVKDNPELRDDLAVTYSKIGTLSAEIDEDEAIAADKEAIRIYQSLADAHPRDADYRQRLGVCQDNLGRALWRAGKSDDARQAFLEAIRLQEEARGKTDNEPRCLADLGRAYGNLGLLQIDTGDNEGAAITLNRAAEIQEPLLAAKPDDPERMRDLAATLNKQGKLQADHQVAKSIELYQRAAGLQEKANLQQPDYWNGRNDLALTYINLGVAQSRADALDDAAKSYDGAIRLMKDLVDRAAGNMTYRRTLARAYNNLALTQNRFDDNAAAEASFRSALDLQQALVKQDPQNHGLQSELGGMYNNLGIVLERMKRFDEAVVAYEEAVARQRHALSQAPGMAKYRQFLDRHYNNYGRALRLAGRADDALRASLARRDLWPKDPDHLFAVAEELASAANDRAVKGRPGSIASEYAEQAMETLKQAIAAGWKPKPDSNWTRSFAAIRNRPDFLTLTF